MSRTPDEQVQDLAISIRMAVEMLNSYVREAAVHNLIVHYSLSDSDNPIMAVTVSQRI